MPLYEIIVKSTSYPAADPPHDRECNIHTYRANLAGFWPADIAATAFAAFIQGHGGVEYVRIVSLVELPASPASKPDPAPASTRANDSE